MVGMPVSVLAAWSRVHIEDGVDSMLSTDIDDPVQMLEPRLLENAGVHIICDWFKLDLRTMKQKVRTDLQSDGS